MTPNDPALPDVPMNIVLPKSPVAGRVVSNSLCMNGKSASFVRHVEIDVSDTPLEGNFYAGQSFGVIPPGVDVNGRPHKVRLYSIACPTWGEDGEGRVISTTPKRLIDEHKPQRDEDDPDDHSLFLGVASNYLCDLRPGDEVMLSGPNGKRFLLPTDPGDHDYLFLATGTGIAPFRGFLTELLLGRNGPVNSEIHLVMGTAYTTDLLYHQFLTDLDQRFDNFHYHTAISRERRPDGRRGLYVHQLIDEQLGQFGDLLQRQRTLVYLCGLIGMQFGLYQLLAEQPYCEEYIRIGDELSDSDPHQWTTTLMRRHIKTTPRVMVEVY